MKITFKTVKPTGRYRTFYSPYHEVKFGGELIGNIDNDAPHKIRLMVNKQDINEDGNPNCKWRWRTLKAEFKNIPEAKEFISKHQDGILELIENKPQSNTK